MSIKANSILRSAVLLGITFAAFAMTPTATMAQAPRPDFPGAKQQGPDFPGAKQQESQPNFEPAIIPLGDAPQADLPKMVTPDEALSTGKDPLDR
jgi:hypothetical protein